MIRKILFGVSIFFILWGLYSATMKLLFVSRATLIEAEVVENRPSTTREGYYDLIVSFDDSTGEEVQRVARTSTKKYIVGESVRVYVTEDRVRKQSLRDLWLWPISEFLLGFIILLLIARRKPTQPNL